VNDSPRKFANCVAKAILVDGKPHIALFALTNIPSGCELRFDYGGGSQLPWRKVRQIYFVAYMTLLSSGGILGG